MTQREARDDTNAGRTEPVGFPMASADDAHGRRVRDARRAGSEFARSPYRAPADVRGAADEYEADPDADPRGVDYIE